MKFGPKTTTALAICMPRALTKPIPTRRAAIGRAAVLAIKIGCALLVLGAFVEFCIYDLTS